MYKTVNTIIDSSTLKSAEDSKREQFNTEMDAKIQGISFSKLITVKADTLDNDFAILANTSYAP